jgi:predicted extracellular nuclease
MPSGFRIAAAALVVNGACIFDPTKTGGYVGTEATSTGVATDTSNPTSTATSPTTESSTVAESTVTDPTSTTEPSTTVDPDSTTEASTSTDSGSPSTSEDSSTTEARAELTIYEIRQGDVPLDTSVMVSGAICTAVASNGFFLQDPAGGEWSAIWVFTGVDARLPGLGDVLMVAGTYEEFFELSTINVSDGMVTVIDSPGEDNVPAPEAIDVDEIGESWESVFLRLSDASIRVAELHPMPAIHDFRVEPSAGGTVWVDDLIYDATTGDFASFGVDAAFTMIQGPLNYAFSEYRIAPRSMTDLAGYVPP